MSRELTLRTQLARLEAMRAALRDASGALARFALLAGSPLPSGETFERFMARRPNENFETFTAWAAELAAVIDSLATEIAAIEAKPPGPCQAIVKGPAPCGKVECRVHFGAPRLLTYPCGHWEPASSNRAIFPFACPVCP